MATMVQQPAKILLAEKRFSYESSEYRCLSTPIYQNGVDKSTLRFSDETLAPQKSRLFTSDEDVTVILLPLVGTVVYESLENEHSRKIAPEELQVLSIKTGEHLSIKNPSEDNLVNYLQIWVKQHSIEAQLSFSDYSNNVLKTILETQNFKLHFGVFDGRMESDFFASNEQNTIMAFVINGAFELQNRLLESRDCLALWNIHKIELEALSENAIILILEKNNSC
ncbi:hypothetical protein J0X14_06045 [Muricauda sp. CAU 1633]|uniref:pirin family protein n=1 Tax=Allomuricauda sp. CAU 1633 TaxID=2816036 RepID=UPI001A8E04F7|nr:hypothetical protein [Muricauda sp. CAU 1633]MBO0321850.1 hypothetical protein [Muricauda sp. CAU 1633]